MKTIKQTKSEEDARLEVRIPESMKRSIKRAASVRGVSLSSFVKYHLQEAANKVLSEDYVILTSEKDKELFYDALMNPPKPGADLIRRAKRFKSHQKSQH